MKSHRAASACFVAFTVLAFTDSNRQTLGSQLPTNDETWVTILSQRSGHNVLYKMRSDGSEMYPLLGGPVSSLPVSNDNVSLLIEPHFTRQSPDGQLFASWVVQRGIPHDEWRGQPSRMLWVGDLDGNWTNVISTDGTEAFAWSPDSRRIAYSVLSKDRGVGFFDSSKDCTQIVIAGFDGSEVEYVLEHSGTWLVQDWSPDGESILLVNARLKTPLSESTSDLYEFSLAEAEAARREVPRAALRGSEWSATIAHQFLRKVECDVDGLYINNARYSPNGESMALLLADPKNLYAPNLVAEDEVGRMFYKRLLGRIAIFDFQTKSTSTIARFESGLRGPICWTPDGSEVMFSSFLDADDDRERTIDKGYHGLSIWSVAIEGQTMRFVTTGWSPDCSTFNR